MQKGQDQPLYLAGAAGVAGVVFAAFAIAISVVGLLSPPLPQSTAVVPPIWLIPVLAGAALLTSASVIVQVIARRPFPKLMGVPSRFAITKTRLVLCICACVGAMALAVGSLLSAASTFRAVPTDEVVNFRALSSITLMLFQSAIILTVTGWSLFQYWWQRQHPMQPGTAVPFTSPLHA